MKFTIICVLFFLRELQGMAVPVLNGRDFTCAADGFFPSATDCCSGLYYACLDGVAYEQNCPGNEVYSPVDDRCEPLLTASCGSLCVPGSSSSTVSSSTQSTPTTASTTIETTSTTTSSTQSTTTTTSTTESTTQITSPTTIRTTPDGGGFDCPTSNGFFAIPGTCGSEYYACVDGSPYVEICPGGSIFDPQLLICVNADDASCNDNLLCPAVDGAYPYPGDCTRYIICSNGEIASVGTCTPPLVFNPVNHFCDYPSNVPNCQ